MSEVSTCLGGKRMGNLADSLSSGLCILPLHRIRLSLSRKRCSCLTSGILLNVFNNLHVVVICCILRIYLANLIASLYHNCATVAK